MTRFALTLAAALALAFAARAADRPFTIAIHGGSGHITRTSLTPERESAYRAALSEALEAGRRVLAAGGASVDAVAAAVMVMEDSPLFNAGRGAVFSSAGANEMDASIMEGSSLRAGAVAGVRTVRNPIAAARAVMEKSAHVFLSGSGADEFAREQGLALADAAYFRTEERWQQLLRARSREGQPAQRDAAPAVPEKRSAASEDEKFGTVGAVALDKAGNLAAATSTGGLNNKRFGRIGDSPVIGAGNWAENDSVAVSATGTGEMFIRTAAAHDIAALVKYKGLSAQAAADAALAKVTAIGGRGGVVVLDRTGVPVFSFTTEGMYRGFARGNEKSTILIHR